MAMALLVAGAPANDPCYSEKHGGPLCRWAIYDSDRALFLAAKMARAPVSEPDANGLAPLHLAVIRGENPLAKELIDAWAKVNWSVARRGDAFYDDEGAAYRATDDLLAQAADPGGDLNVVRTLLAYGAETETKANTSGRGAALHVAVEAGRLDMAEAILKGGAKPDSRDDRGRTPLHCAARRGNEPAVKILLAAGANPKAKDKDGKTPLDLAKESGFSLPALEAAGFGSN